MTKKALHSYQPIRPITSPETGNMLLHRTFPRMQKRMPSLVTTPYQVIQMRLYRSLREKLFPNHALVSELREWLFGDLSFVNHINFGSTILQSVRYEARKLMNRKSMPKAAVIYSFNELLELEYGLEWQICTWLPRFLQEAGLHEGNFGIEDCEYFLNEIGTLSKEDYMIDYEEPIQIAEISEKFTKMDWSISWAEMSEGMREAPIPIPAGKRREPPKSIL